MVTELDGTLSIDKNRFSEYFAENPEHFAAVTTSMIRTGDAGITGSAQLICSLQEFMASPYQAEQQHLLTPTQPVTQ